MVCKGGGKTLIKETNVKYLAIKVYIIYENV